MLKMFHTRECPCWEETQGVTIKVTTSLFGLFLKKKNDKKRKEKKEKKRKEKRNFHNCVVLFLDGLSLCHVFASPACLKR